MKTHSTHQKIISPQVILFLLIVAFIGVAMIFSVIYTAPRTQQTTAASCGCNPPPDTHGWTDNMCFFPPETAGCPQTFAGGYCDPNGDKIYDDADWDKGYYEYRSLCPNSPTGGVVPTTNPGGGTVSPTSPAEPTPTAIPTQKPLDLNECIGYDVYGLADRLRQVNGGNELADKMLERFKEICAGRTGGGNLTPGPTNAPGVTSAVTPGTGGTNTGFPSSLIEFFNSTKVTSEAMQYIGQAKPCADNMEIYQQAARQGGLPENLAPVLAGIHFIEGSCNNNQSLRNGSSLSKADPQGGLTCSSQDTGPGKAVPIGGGCQFPTVLDSAIWAAKHFVGKSGVPSKLEDLVYSYGLYNGTGNNNCGKYSYVLNGKYSWCPEKFKGEAHPYGMNKMGALFEEYIDYKWYILYCADGQLCADPKEFQRPNAAMIALLAWRQFIHAL